MTILLKEDVIRSAMKYHKVESETEGVQRFYGGEYATIIIENKSNLDEVIDVLKMPVTKSV